MLRLLRLPGAPAQLPPCTGGWRPSRNPASRTLSAHVQPCLPGRRRLTVPGPHGPHAARSYRVTQMAEYCDLSAQKYSMVYTLPHIKLLRAVSRLKLLQTGITVAILPPVFYFYLQGDVSDFLVTYTTGIALFAGAMLYTASHFLRRVVGMMYLDSSHSTLKVSHLTFWGKRRDIYLPVSDVMTLGDTGDALSEPILKLKRYSSPLTMYFSPRFGRIVDKQAFEKVFGALE